MVPAEGGFDFLLSDWGMEFFLPKGPPTRAELLRYYSFRRTGRPALGLPKYLEDPDSAVSIDSPTGPSQIRLNADLPSLSVLGPECADAVKCIRAKLGDYNGPAITAKPPTRLYSLEEYKCLMSAVRCWQVEGAVYRAIATEAPRIVAGAWIELDNADYFGKTAPVTQASYLARFSDPGNDGLRRCFEERLETMLPDASRMRFEALQAGSARPVGWSAVWGWWKDDIMITSRGFFLPALPPLPTCEEIIAEIAEGRAGNPIFTDSKRTQT